MDADGALKPSHEAKLVLALLDAYVQLTDLALMLAERADKPFETLPDDGDRRSRVFRLVQAAKGGGWLPLLISCAHEDRPRNDDLRFLAGLVGPIQGREDPPAAQRTLDLAYFDLDGLRRAVATAVYEASDRVLAFGVTYMEETFVRRLCEWIKSHLGETQVKDKLNLRPNLITISTRLRQMASYRRELDARNVLCLVDTEGAEADTVTEFWNGVCRNFSGIPRYLVLIFASGQGMNFPADVTVLPDPRFELADVALWTHDMLRLRGWPMDLASAWTNRLRDHARLDDGSLDVRLLYEAMEQTIEEARFDPARFRQQLEESSGYAHATPA